MHAGAGAAGVRRLHGCRELATHIAAVGELGVRRGAMGVDHGETQMVG